MGGFCRWRGTLKSFIFKAFGGLYRGAGIKKKYFRADTSESVQEIISDNEIDSLVSDPDKVVDIIMYVKNEAAKQDISDDQIRSLIQTAESTAGVSLSEEEENRIIKIVKQIKDSDIDEEQLRSAVTKAYDKLEEMGIGKEEVKGILHKLADFAKSLFE